MRGERSWTAAVLTLSLLFGAAACCGAAEDAKASERTNIVFLFADDLGYGDIGSYGAPDAKTPNIDSLARDGVRFTQFYSNGPECTPTRTALMTGRYQQRAGGLECAIGTGNVGRYDDAIRLANRDELGLPPKLAVLPRTLDEAGYALGCFGKWHLGYERKFNPRNYGFDAFFGCLGGNVDYFTHRELSDLEVLFRDRNPVEREGYMTRLIGDDAVSFIRERKGGPFFLYVPFTAPHFPFQGPDDDTGKMVPADEWTKGNRATYVEMIESMDRQIGRILESLEEAGLAGRTLVVFASDNGAMEPGRNAPFSGYKGGLFEGGIRVPLVARWPGRIEPGQVCEQTCATFDLTRSFLRAEGGGEARHGLDGIDILEHVADGREDRPRTLFWRARRGLRTWRAVRDGDLKYVSREEDGQFEQWLFDLAADPEEKDNLLKTRRADAERLIERLGEWEAEVKPMR